MKEVRYIRKYQSPGMRKQAKANIDESMREMFKSSDSDLKITIEHDAETRRQAQNRLIWHINNQAKKHLEEHYGLVENAEDLHDYFVGKILPKRVVTIMGEPEVKRTQTSKLNVADCAEYINKLVQYLLENYNLKAQMPDDLMHIAIYGKTDTKEQKDEF